MAFFDKVFDDILGVTEFAESLTGADAAQDAAEIQAQAAREGQGFQRDALAAIRGDLQPFRDIGVNSLAALQSSVQNNPLLTAQGQADFIRGNPLFAALADESAKRITNLNAARGKAFSGDTELGINNALAAVANNLINQQFARQNTQTGNLFNLASLGANAAAQTGTASQNTASNLANLGLQGANALAAGQVAKGQAPANFLTLGLQGATAAAPFALL